MMFPKRPKQRMVWLGVLAVIAAVLFLWPSEERAGGPFQIRTVARAELRAGVSGFLQDVSAEEGDAVAEGQVIARVNIPDLKSKIAQKRAEVVEVTAQLRALEAGPREIEIKEQRGRVARAREWCTLAQSDLAQARKSTTDELKKLDEQIAQQQAESDFAQLRATREAALVAQKVIAKEQYLEHKKEVEVSQAQLNQVESQKRAREAMGTLAAEAELVRREKDLADAEATLSLLLAGTRPETIDAERSRLARLKEEMAYLESLEEKILIRSPVHGLITLPRGRDRSAQPGHEIELGAGRLRDRIGQYCHEGDLICTIEEPSVLEADVAVDEQDSARIEVGQRVELKVRALPFQTFSGIVERIAPSAVPGEVQSTVHVTCRLDNPSRELKPGMSGHARISYGRRASGALLVEKVLRYFRTEMWW